MKNEQSRFSVHTANLQAWIQVAGRHSLKRNVLFFLFFSVWTQIHAETLIYTIKEGDSLESIAERFEISAASLVKINRFRNHEEAQQSIVHGESILIPRPQIVLASVNSNGIQSDVVPTEEIVANPVLPTTKKDKELHNYTVQAGDSISSLAVRFDSSSEAILEANPLASDHIRVGQLLKIPSPQANFTAPIILHAATRLDKEQIKKEQTYTVEKGDTLLKIGRKTETSIGVIRSLNQLEDDYIRPGQILRISSYEQAVQTIAANRQGTANQQAATNRQANLDDYTVQKGDTLSSISRKLGISISQLKQSNQLSNLDFLKIGQKLRTSGQLQGYTVAKGDTLWSISRRLDTSVEQLQDWNPELGSILRPGQTLSVGLVSYPKTEQTQAPEPEDSGPEYPEPQDSEPQEVAPPQDKNRPIGLKSYFTHYAPRVERQPNATYYEEFTDDPLENYQTARKLFAEFEREVNAMPKLSNTLKGYHILIDPGHGGLDPGFNSQSEDGNGNPLYIIEDEYNYDYGLRLCRLLKRHGAKVSLTIISPNQLIIDSPDASRTLVSQKNEVYNSPFINQRGEYNSWPIGTPTGLHKRVEVAESFFNGTPKNKRIFISLHNDNSPWDKDGRLVLYYDDSLTIDRLGEGFGKHMVPFLGKNAHVRGQNLAVLRKNPAKYAVLVELRNIAYSRNSWAIRSSKLRQEDTEMLGNGILSFVKSL